jgi:hypothetical protein
MTVVYNGIRSAGIADCGSQWVAILTRVREAHNLNAHWIAGLSAPTASTAIVTECVRV